MSRVALLVSVLAAVLGAQEPATGSFDAASIKVNTSNERTRVSAVPRSGRLTITAMTVKGVILAAYGLHPFELVDNGDKVLDEKVDIVAKSDTATTVADLQRMLQPLLAERFKLVTHRDTRELDAYVVTRARADRLGPKLVIATGDCTRIGNTNSFAREEVAPAGPGEARCGIAPGGIGRIIANGMDMRGILNFVFTSPRRAVVDQTGLTGRYNVDVTYTPDTFSAAALAQRGATAPDGVDPNGPPLFTALQEQLGLKVEERRIPVPVVVIDRVEALSPD